MAVTAVVLLFINTPVFETTDWRQQLLGFFGFD